MRPERVIGRAMRAYPREARRADREEILGTALDLSAGSWRLLWRESLALVRGGLRARARISAEGGPRRLVADACCQAATLMGTVSIADAIVGYLTTRYTHPDVAVVISGALLGGFVLLALLGYDRAAAPCGVAAVAAELIVPLVVHAPRFDWVRSPAIYYLVAAQPVLLVLYGVMFSAPRTRRRNPRRLLWLAAALLLTAVMRASLGWESYAMPDLIVLLVLPFAGLSLLAIGPPRLAVVGVVVWIASVFEYWITLTTGGGSRAWDHLLGGWNQVLLVGAAGMLVIVVLTCATRLRLRALRDQLPG